MSEEVKSMYDEIKKKKNHRYLVFYIKDEKTIAVEKIGTLSLLKMIQNSIDFFLY